MKRWKLNGTGRTFRIGSEPHNVLFVGFYPFLSFSPITLDEQTEEGRFAVVAASFFAMMLLVYSDAEETTMSPTLFAEIRVTSIIKRALLLKMNFVSLANNTMGEALTPLQISKLHLIIDVLTGFIREKTTTISIPPRLSGEPAGGAGAASS